jgi:hypothetical protein
MDSESGEAMEEIAIGREPQNTGVITVTDFLFSHTPVTTSRRLEGEALRSE